MTRTSAHAAVYSIHDAPWYVRTVFLKNDIPVSTALYISKPNLLYAHGMPGRK